MTRMTQALALRVVDQLRGIAAEPPGSGRLAEAHALLRFLHEGHAHDRQLLDAMGRTRECIALLASSQRWQRVGPDKVRADAALAVEKLRHAIETRWPVDSGDSTGGDSRGMGYGQERQRPRG